MQTGLCKNKHVTVMGLGSFGGGAGAARFLSEQGAHVTVTDTKNEAALGESMRLLDGLGIRFVLGRHEMSDFIGVDMVVVNPAVPKNSEYIATARATGATLTTEIGLFAGLCPAPVCGITGSNGKTTTVSMVRSILEESGQQFWIGGNIGGSLLNDLNRITPDDHIVLELSSFQLEWLDEMSWSPHIAAILNIMPNHLDRHGTYEAYRTAKASILTHQSPGDTAILVKNDSGSASMAQYVKGKTVWVGTDITGDGVTFKDEWITEHRGDHTYKILDSRSLLVPGKHNILNAMAAASCSIEFGIGYDCIKSGLERFRGIPHRLEFVGEHNGVLFYNDSKATTPEATIAAVTSFDRPVIPILGGYDKGVSFREMTDHMAGFVSRAALIGTTAPVISHELERVGIESEIYPSFEEAFTACVKLAQHGDIVILTPGCASYDMFANYEERGEIFKKLVRELSE
ncbi:MAG: UDP-N-acetylmuramoyl-L-alanine--D-glutamate ligase [Candidatus Latescibacteria bacterium]|nr:UDP-N-acetylmuramoyl-L-alanine--D-glutamate ligase [Candidatus Latescibacterota bacterium]